MNLKHALNERAFTKFVRQSSLSVFVGSAAIFLVTDVEAAILNTTNSTSLVGAIGAPAGTISTYAGDPSSVGISTTPLANFPPAPETKFLILSSGRVTDISTPNSSGSQGTDLGALGVAGDTASLSLTIPVPKKAGAIGFNFTFLSEEFPEYVGSAFNDFFRARLNGSDIVRDINGKPIEVNNNFFDPGLSANGTFFDGQTTPLSVRASLPKGAENVNLTLQVGDVGDGVYDSAAFVSGLQFFFPQTVFVATGAASVPISQVSIFDKILGAPSSFSKPSSLYSATDIAAGLDEIFSPFLFDFTTTKPTSGDFSTLYIGGGLTDIPAKTRAAAGLPNNLTGLASSVDYGNSNQNDTAFAFDKLLDGTARALADVVQTAAHELGHILGLAHVEKINELMSRFADPTATVISNADAKLSHSDGTQNSFKELTRNVGLKESAIVVEEASAFDKFKQQIKIFFGSLFQLFDAKIGIFTPGEDALPTMIEIGDINFGMEKLVEITIRDGDQLFVVGSSSDGGMTDIFSIVDLNMLPNEIDFQAISRQIDILPGQEFAKLAIPLFEFTDEGEFRSFTTITIAASNVNSVPEPTTIVLLALGLLSLLISLNNKKLVFPVRT